LLALAHVDLPCLMAQPACRTHIDAQRNGTLDSTTSRSQIWKARETLPRYEALSRTVRPLP
jgi:hypothetical protein